MRLPAICVLFLAGCATSTRFADRPILWHDPDAFPIPVPKPHTSGIQYNGFRDAILNPADRALSLDYGGESVNVNAYDEVPDSSWFVDRRRTADAHVHPRQFSAEEMSSGGFGKDPLPTPPFTITSGKATGSTPGLVVNDAHGVKYLLKLDPKGQLGLNTSAEAVATRLAWASGWLVPAEVILDIKPEDLVLDPKAKTKDKWDQKIPFDKSIIDKFLEVTPREEDGTIRVCASKWLEGKPLGWWRYYGRKEDDPNDRIFHQDRRDVRGFGVWAAWVNDIDTMENNTFDAYVGKEGKGHVVHYQQDVGGSFGQFAAVPSEVWMSEETFFMPGRIVASLVSFGALQRTWNKHARESRRTALMKEYPQLGYFDDKGFNPFNWHPVLDNPAFVRQTARDRYWGAKRVVAFNEEEVRAAIKLGHYPAATEERLFEILWNRRTAIARAFFSDVSPIDYFHFDGTKLCFSDLWLEAGLGHEDKTTYVAALDGATQAEGHDRWVETTRVSGYHIIALSARHEGEAKNPTMQVHFVVKDGAAHVVGLQR